MKHVFLGANKVLHDWTPGAMPPQIDEQATGLRGFGGRYEWVELADQADAHDPDAPLKEEK